MNPKCPYCGAEMRLLPFNACGGWTVDFKQWIDKMSVSYQCSICFAKSPTAWASTTKEAKERALSAAMQRYVEPANGCCWCIADGVINKVYIRTDDSDYTFVDAKFCPKCGRDLEESQ
jgi:hypothetical protein